MRQQIDLRSSISIQRQCELLGFSRSAFYYVPCQETTENLTYMRLLDEQYLKTPFFGVGQFTDWLRQQGYEVNPKRVRRLLRLMGLSAVCPGPHTSRPGKAEGHKIYPYLLRDVVVNQVGQVYGTDITARAAPVYSAEWRLFILNGLYGLVQPVYISLGPGRRGGYPTAWIRLSA